MCVQNLKFVALPVPEIIGGTVYPTNLGSPWIHPCSLFSKIFNGGFVPMDSVNAPTKFEVRSFSHS